jgi:hypothetical protein
MRGQRGAHVHEVPDGVTDDGVRAVDAPAEPVPLGRPEQLVLLGVVEVLARQPGLVLVERGVPGRADAVRLERAEVVLQAGQQRDVAHPAQAPAGLEDVADHRRVDRDVQRLGRLAAPRSDEKVRRAHVGQCRGHRLRVGEVGAARLDARYRGARAARQPDHLPPTLDEFRGDRLPRDTGRADDERQLAATAVSLIHVCP